MAAQLSRPGRYASLGPTATPLGLGCQPFLAHLGCHVSPVRLGCCAASTLGVTHPLKVKVVLRVAPALSVLVVVALWAVLEWVVAVS